MGNAEETDLEDEDVDDKRGMHDDVDGGFVNPDYLYDE